MHCYKAFVRPKLKYQQFEITFFSSEQDVGFLNYAYNEILGYLAPKKIDFFFYLFKQKYYYTGLKKCEGHKNKVLKPSPYIEFSI